MLRQLLAGRIGRWAVLGVVFVGMYSARADHVVLQVEDFEGPWRKQTNISGFQGKGFCTSNAKPGAAKSVMATTLTLRKGGKHAVWVRAYTSENSRRALQMHVNAAPLDVTHTSSERRWAWERAGEVDLAPGKIAIAVHDAADGFESADAVLLTDRKDFDPQMAEQNEKRWSVYKGSIPNEASAIRFMIDAACAPLANHKDPASKEQWDTDRAAVKKNLAKALGLNPMPERTPLKARVTGRAERDAYHIENVVFESRPNFLVTANVYIPKNTPLPAPAVVVVPGHAMEDAKNYELYQMAQLGLARMGILVLALDPIGQGERKVPGFSHPMGYGSLLVGQTNEGYITWDTLRAFDYLATRADVDVDRMGLAGNSGGGENTFYAMPFDERIKAGASFCFVCSYEQWLLHGGNHCICNHLPGIVHDMEQFQIIGLNTPRAFLFGNGAKDKIFPIAGTRDTYRRAQSIYEFYGAKDSVKSVEADMGHGWSQPLREACYGWMSRWLLGKGDGSPIPEGEYEAEDPKSPDVLCFDGNMLPEDSETVVQRNQKLAEKLRQAYMTPPANKKEWDVAKGSLREAIWTVLGGQPADTAPTARPMDSFAREDHTVETLGLTTEPGMEIACLLITPKKSKRSAPAAICLLDGGKTSVRHNQHALALLDGGTTVLALDVRGLGETAAGINENHLVSDGVHLGRPVFAQRVWDVIQAARYLARRDGIDAKRIQCYGEGAQGLLAVYAAALGASFESVTADKPLASFRYFIENDQPQPIWLCAPNILKVTDVAQAAALSAPARLEIRNPIGYGKAPLSADEATTEFAFTKRVYALSGNENGLLIRADAKP